MADQNTTPQPIGLDKPIPMPEGQPTAPKGTPEYDQQMIAYSEKLLANAMALDSGNPILNTPSEPVNGIPSKFKTVEELANAYAELEKKLGSAIPPAPTEQAAPSDTAKATPAPIPSSLEKVAELVEGKGLNFNALLSEVEKSGDLSTDQYKALADAGFSNEFVKGTIEGQKALITQATNALYEKVGGKEAYDQMIQWAGTSLSADEIKTFNDAIVTGDKVKQNLALDNLSLKFKQNAPPNMVSGVANIGNGIPSGSMFQSEAELIDAMSDKRYKYDTAYQRQVQEKLLKSNLFKV